MLRRGLHITDIPPLTVTELKNLFAELGTKPLQADDIKAFIKKKYDFVFDNQEVGDPSPYWNWGYRSHVELQKITYAEFMGTKSVLQDIYTQF